MSETFWNNTIWFILLFFTSIVTIAITLYKSSDIKFDIAFLFSIIGLTFLLEAILVIGLNSYVYHPKFFSDLILDSVIGNYFSQISISSTALMISVYRLSSFWCLIFAFIYYLIEELFLKLGVFEHFWYRSIYTLFGFLPFFWLMNKWYLKAKESSNNYINYITLFFSIIAINSFTIYTSQRLLGIQVFKGNFFPDISKDHITTGFIYIFIVINLLIVLYKSKLKWFIKVIVFSCLFFGQYLLYSTGLIFIPKGLFFIVTSFDLFGCYCWIAIFNYFLSKKSSAVLS